MMETIERPRIERIRITPPGLSLRDEYLKELGVTPYRLAKDIGVAPLRITEILNGKRGISAETGILLDRYFGKSRGFFHRLQAGYDSALAEEKLADKLQQIKPIREFTGPGTIPVGEID
jgi:addiction module HigA family antidote